MRTRKIVAKNKVTGTQYDFCEKTEHGDFYLVSTPSSATKWLVNADRVDLLSNPTHNG